MISAIPSAEAVNAPLIARILIVHVAADLTFVFSTR